MLPGFRFLFGAIVLAMSTLVFGFGAAALLRTAHEEFASAPAWRPAPETRFAQSQETQATQPVLALLRVDDTPKDEVKDQNKDPSKDTLKGADKDAAKVEPQVLNDATAPSPQPEPDKTAALQPPSDTAPSAAALEAAPPRAEAPPAAPDQTRLATTAQPSTDAPAPTTTAAAPAGEAAPLPAAEAAAAPVPPEPVSVPAAASFSTKIATLGGPPVTISPKAASPKPDREDRDAVRKRQAHRTAHRRRLAALRLQQQQAGQQQQLSPFGQAPNQNPTR